MWLWYELRKVIPAWTSALNPLFLAPSDKFEAFIASWVKQILLNSFNLSPTHLGSTGKTLDRPQSLFYFVPQESQDWLENLEHEDCKGWERAHSSKSLLKKGNSRPLVASSSVYIGPEYYSGPMYTEMFGPNKDVSSCLHFGAKSVVRFAAQDLQYRDTTQI